MAWSGKSASKTGPPLLPQGHARGCCLLVFWVPSTPGGLELDLCSHTKVNPGRQASLAVDKPLMVPQCSFSDSRPPHPVYLSFSSLSSLCVSVSLHFYLKWTRGLCHTRHCLMLEPGDSKCSLHGPSPCTTGGSGHPLEPSLLETLGSNHWSLRILDLSHHFSGLNSPLKTLSSQLRQQAGSFPRHLLRNLTLFLTQACPSFNSSVVLMVT